MGKLIPEGVELNKLKSIPTDGGYVLHALKKNEKSYRGFGEAYFSVINYGIIRGWKKHREMTLNLVVPVGKIKFVIIDDRKFSDHIKPLEFILSNSDYSRLTVPPGFWMAFQGMSQGENILLNLSDIVHDPAESDHKDIKEFSYDWDLCKDLNC